jgi:hypothetical protein
MKGDYTVAKAKQFFHLWMEMARQKVLISWM